MSQKAKHEWNVGRWRVVFKFGRYRTGLIRRPGYFSWGLPFMWGHAIRRNRRAKQA